MKHTSIDIGSNTLRLLIAQKRHDRWQRCALMHSVTRLSGGFDGSLRPEAMRRTAEKVAEFAQIARNEDAFPIRGACTGVCRKAENVDEFLDLLEEVAGFRPVVISGETEATLTALGAVSLTELGQGPFVLFDIGGFSTEIIFIRGGEPEKTVSLDLGTVKLTEDFFPNEIPTREQLKNLTLAVKAPIKREADKAKSRNFKADALVGTAGTVTSLAAMAQGLPEYNSEKVEGHRLTGDVLEKILGHISKISAAQRLNDYPSLEKGREDVLIAGILICMEMLRHFGFDRIVATEGGLLEGLVNVSRFP